MLMEATIDNHKINIDGAFTRRLGFVIRDTCGDMLVSGLKYEIWGLYSTN
jgi:hypothetical protein